MNDALDLLVNHLITTSEREDHIVGLLIEYAGRDVTLVVGTTPEHAKQLDAIVDPAPLPDDGPNWQEGTLITGAGHEIPVGAKREEVNHPDHYGGADDPYEPIKIIEAKGLGFHDGNALKYLLRAGHKPGTSAETDLRKAAWYLQRHADHIAKHP